MSFPAPAQFHQCPVAVENSSCRNTCDVHFTASSIFSDGPSSLQSGFAPLHFNYGKLAMLLFKLLNPKSLSLKTAPSKRNPAKNNLNNPTGLASQKSSKHHSDGSPHSPSFFHYNGLGEVLIPISSEQSGRIHFRGTDWPAQLCPQRYSQHQEKSNIQTQVECIVAGRKVQVVGRQGITLLVATL